MPRNYKALIVWQLADELRAHVVRVTGQGPAMVHRDFASDLRRSARSVAANIAEGFGRFQPKEFHRFLQIARASLLETESHLRDGLEHAYFIKTEHDEAHALIRRITVALSSLMRYLRSQEAQRHGSRTRRT